MVDCDNKLYTYHRNELASLAMNAVKDLFFNLIQRNSYQKDHLLLTSNVFLLNLTQINSNYVKLTRSVFIIKTTTFSVVSIFSPLEQEAVKTRIGR